MTSRLLLVAAALTLVVALVVADTEQFPFAGSLNRGATAAQSGNLAASAYGKQAAQGSIQAKEAQQVAQGQKAAATAAAAAQATAFGKNAYEARIAQALVGVLSYCEGYICTEWLDEFGAAYTNAGAAASQTAEGFGEYAQRANQASAADRAAFAAQQQAARGEQYGAASGALRGNEAYGQGLGASQSAYGAGSPWGVPAYGVLSGSQAQNVNAAAQAGQFGALSGREAAGVNAKLAASDQARALESAAAQAKAAQANAAAAKQTAFTVEQLSRLKNYGRKCRRYQCYHKFWDGKVVSYGPNYYTAQGQAFDQDQAQAAQQAAFADQAALAKQQAYGAEAGVANQYGAGGVGAQEAGYASGYGAGVAPGYYGYY